MSLVNNLIVRLRSNRRKQNDHQRSSVHRKSPPHSRRQSRANVDYPTLLPDHDDETSFHEPFPSVSPRAYVEYYCNQSKKDEQKASTLNSSLSRHTSTSSHASPSSSSDHDYNRSLSSCHSAIPAIEHHRSRSFSVSSVFFLTRPSRRSRSLSAGRRAALNEETFNPYQYPLASVSVTGSLGTCTSTATTTSSHGASSTSTTAFPIAASPVTPVDSPMFIAPSGTRPVARRSLVNRKRPPLSMIMEDNLDPNKQESKDKLVDGFWTVSITGEKVKKRVEGEKKLQKRGRTRLHVTNSPSLANLLPNIPHSSRAGENKALYQGSNGEEALSDEESRALILPPGLSHPTNESSRTPAISPSLPIRHPARRSLSPSIPDSTITLATEKDSRPPSAWKDNFAVRRSIQIADDQQDGGDDVDDSASFMTATSQLSS
ncbi:hypothetical protein BDN72DRAFT_853312 [Pluteus cervinus]|uniref:Uncharacterized protein n=1 Tax=Pluteus cervinus TaxID=181527 RepID=A0ACD3BCD1_9AGAR|nr:hypothetical protein BDN72DRAFT_853312 [Pluteus cervinus]